MKMLPAVLAFVLPITCLAQLDAAADGAVLEVPDNLFCSGFEACPPFCGDGTQDPGEVCDDGNQVDGDGCSANCLSDETCGNGITDYYAGETCDDGNTEDGDGCSAACQLGCVQDTTRPCGDVGGLGVCAGIEVCDAGTWGSCSAQDPTAEVCDGLDNDCNGATDEDFPELGGTCSVGVGACRQFGIFTCNPQDPTEPPICDANPNPPGIEICNGIDDDCDGDIDNGVPPESCSNQAGVCLGSTRLCGGALGYIACSFAEYGADYEPQELSCDGLDNDCDGAADADLPLQPCSLQAGVCAGSVKTCAGVGGWQACGATEFGLDYEPEEVSCDYKDNDCDGEVDEPFDLATDADNCGYCGYACVTPDNAIPVCEFSSCGYVCQDNWYECDYNPANGCESSEPCS